MNIEEILSRLERIDHKEYSIGFEFADSSTFDEMSRCFEERKKLSKEIERQKEIIRQLDIKNLELSTIIKEVREYIKDKYDYVLGDDTFLDHDERIDSKQIKHILGILDKENNNENN